MKKALVIGIDGYPKAPLDGCVNDAVAFASIIEKHGNGDPNFDVVLIADRDGVSKKGELKGKMKELFAGDSDAVLLYFSGHGILNELGGYLITPDFAENDEGISMEEILTLANNSKAKDKIIILDCCSSGAFGNPQIANTTSAISEGMSVLTASRKDQKAVEINGHGLFTSLLLDALSGGASDILGRITPGSLYSYVDKALGSWEQRPIFKTNVSRFTIIRQVAPHVPIDTLRKIPEYFPSPEHQFQLDPTYEPEEKEKAIKEHVEIFGELQKLEGVGLVVPVGEEHMYWAAMNSKACRLTATGHLFWKLADEGKI